MSEKLPELPENPDTGFWSDLEKQCISAYALQARADLQAELDAANNCLKADRAERGQLLVENHRLKEQVGVLRAATTQFLEALEAEAKATLVADNAKDNFSDPQPELDAVVRSIETVMVRKNRLVELLVAPACANNTAWLLEVITPDHFESEQLYYKSYGRPINGGRDDLHVTNPAPFQAKRFPNEKDANDYAERYGLSDQLIAREHLFNCGPNVVADSAATEPTKEPS